MHSRPSHTTRKHKRSWLSAAAVGAVLLFAVMAWRSLRMPEPRPRRDS
ncbi:hypothetical protein [Arthrobacter silvisoli]|nr:hypothetical protein [Arthrobacter silvisoli]